MAFLGQLFQASTPPSPPLMKAGWRPTYLTERDRMIEDIKALEVSNSDISSLHILLLGPVGSGKSSFINSIDSIFQNRMTCGAAVDGKSHESFTKMYQTHKIKKGRYGEYLPFIISDTMGLEDGYDKGMHPNDAIEALLGHIKDGHKFNQQPGESGQRVVSSARLDDSIHCLENVTLSFFTKFNQHPGEREVSPGTLDDRIHCLVMLLPAGTVSMLGVEVLSKMRDVRERAAELKIPQVALLTKIDETCPEVKKDITLVYRSKKIREKMFECHSRLGVNVSHIFPVKNYHEETDLNPDMDVLLLSALKNILNFANDHVAEIPQTED